MLSLTTLDQAVSAQHREQYKKDEVYVWVHPAWHGFADYETRAPPYPNSGNLLEDTIKEHLLEIPTETYHKGTLAEYSKALFHLNEITFFSASRETQPLVILVLPGNYYKTHKNAVDGKYWLFPKEYEEYIEQSTQSLPNFVVIETKSYNIGRIDKNQKNKLKKLFKSLEIENFYLVGGNVNECLKRFVEDFRSDKNNISIHAISDLCFATSSKLFDMGTLPSGEYLYTVHDQAAYVKEMIKQNQSEIKKYNLQELQQFIYQLSSLNKVLNPEERIWKDDGKPDKILKADQINNAPAVNKFREIVSGFKEAAN